MLERWVYDAAGTLRAVDFRKTANRLENSKAEIVFEEHRYDALGRRVWTRTRKWCEIPEGNTYPAGEEPERCNYDTVRRSVWDGSHTLVQIQRPDTDAAREIDGSLPEQPRLGLTFDPNPLLGRVLYTRGLQTDAPLSAIRMGYGDHPYNQDYQTWSEFAVLPLWSTDGGAPYAVFADGTRTCCLSGDPGRCLGIDWYLEWVTYGATSNAQVISGGVEQVWLGSVMEDRQDASGLLYRRNRYYSPEQGRFVQEDPIGLAGGLNLYGYAGGDPVNFSDPFGLSAEDRDEAGCIPCLGRAALWLAAKWRSISAAGSAVAAGSRAANSPTGQATIRFAQRGISQTFRHGEFAGRTINQVSAGLRSGTIQPNQLPVKVVVRDGVSYAMNNRSLMALRQAGMEPTVINNVTGNALFERQLTQRLAELGGQVADDFVPLIRGLP